MGTELLSEAGLNVTFAAISCGHCGARPSLQIGNNEGWGTICLECLAVALSKLPAKYAESFDRDLSAYRFANAE